jgi:hypothetical protein
MGIDISHCRGFLILGLNLEFALNPLNPRTLLGYVFEEHILPYIPNGALHLRVISIEE